MRNYWVSSPCLKPKPIFAASLFLDTPLTKNLEDQFNYSEYWQLTKEDQLSQLICPSLTQTTAPLFLDLDDSFEMQMDIPAHILSLDVHLKSDTKRLDLISRIHAMDFQMDTSDPSLEEDLQNLMGHCLSLETLICRSKSVQIASFSVTGSYIFKFSDLKILNGSHSS